MLNESKLAWSHRLGRMLSFQSLYAGFLIGTHHMGSLLSQFRGLFIQVTHGFDLLVELLWVFMALVVEPISALMRFQRRLVLKNAALALAKC